MITPLLCGWKINQPQNQCSNLLPACAAYQIVQTLVSTEYFQWSTAMYVNVECFVERFMIQSKVIMMSWKRTIKMIMTLKMMLLTTMVRIFLLINCLIYLGYLVDIFNCVDSGRSLSAMTIQSYLSKRYLGVYISEGLPMIISQV